MKYNFYIRHFGFAVFCIFAILAYLMGYKEDIPQYKLFIHCAIAFFYWALLYLASKIKEERTIISMVFLFSLLTAITLRYLFWDYTGDPYGKIGNCDIYGYEKFVLSSVDISFSEFLQKVSLHGFNIDDYGFFSFLFLLHNFFMGAEFVRNFLLLFNSCLIACSTHLIYKICNCLDFEEEISRMSAAFYGLFPFWTVSTAVGLKENLFCFAIVAALYYIYRYKESHLTRCLIGCVVFITFTYLFRFAVTLMLLIVLAITLICSEQNKKSLLIGMAVAAVILSASLSIIMQSFSGTSMKLVTDVAADRMSRSGGNGFLGWMVHCSAAFIGPFPNFSRTNQYNIYFAAGLINKVLFSVFVNYALYKVIQKLEWKLYPILSYLVMGYIMLLVSGVALDMRYHITFFPAFVILLGYGYSHFQMKSSVLYALGTVGLAITFVYTFR